MDKFLSAAIEEAKTGFAEGGIPIGSVLVVDNRIIARGHKKGFRKGAQYFMPKWIAWKMREE